MMLYTDQGSHVDLMPTGKVGGEGEIFRIVNRADECAKIYHTSKITRELKEKISVMVNNPPDDPTIASCNHRSIAWPISLVFRDTQMTQFAGFTMPYIDTSVFYESFKYYSPSERIRRFGGAFTWRHLFGSAFNFSSACLALHNKGHRIGDLRETNIFISPQSLVTLIDTDSFQVKDNKSGKYYYCRVGTGEYLPPEVIGTDFRNKDIDRYYSDLFALGVIIFKLLMNGFHPFAAKGPLVENSPSIVEKIMKGYFAFEGDIVGAEPPVGSPPYGSVIPPELKILFHKCFVTGYSDPKSRPAAEEWFRALREGVTETRPSP
jgi:DNA-binding helix-hairpin-helix protein with protein kinase domain